MSVTEIKPDTWQVRTEVGKNADGTRRFKYETVHGTRQDAERKEYEIIKAREQSNWVEPSKLLVGPYLLQWLARRGRAKEVRRSTVEAYEQAFRTHLIPQFGGQRLQKLTHLHIEAAYEIMGKKKLSDATILQAHAGLSKALSDAVKDSLIVVNPAKRAKHPPAPRTKLRGRQDALSVSELDRFKDAIVDHKHEEFFLFALDATARRSEMAGLRWCDINLSTGMVSFYEQLSQYKDYTIERTEPKTDAGARLVQLSPDMVEMVRARRERARLAALERGGAAGFETSLVFEAFPKVFTSAFYRIARKLGLDKSLHSLRHTSITGLIDDGQDIKYVSERAGHTSTDFTRDRYQTTNPAGHAKVAESAGKLSSRGKKRTAVVPLRGRV